LRLKLLKMQAQAGDIVLLFADESEALTHPYLAHRWAKRGQDLRIEAPGVAKRRAILGVREAITGEMLVCTSASKKSSDFIDLLAQVDLWYGPESCQHRLPVVLVLDNGPIHTSKASRAALAARGWLSVEWLAKYAPELNAIERDWRHLKAHFLANRTFTDVEELDRSIHQAVSDINRERVHKACAQLATIA
jgi:transposase InsO family protein